MDALAAPEWSNQKEEKGIGVVKRKRKRKENSEIVRCHSRTTSDSLEFVHHYCYFSVFSLKGSGVGLLFSEMLFYRHGGRLEIPFHASFPAAVFHSIRLSGLFCVCASTRRAAGVCCSNWHFANPAVYVALIGCCLSPPDPATLPTPSSVEPPFLPLCFVLCW